jgi:hypothetical protein
MLPHTLALTGHPGTTTLVFRMLIDWWASRRQTQEEYLQLHPDCTTAVQKDVLVEKIVYFTKLTLSCCHNVD